MRGVKGLLMAVIATTVAISCGDRGNDTFGRIPATICQFSADEAKDGEMLSTAQTDRLYSKIYPMFEKIHGKLIPFTADDGLGYDVESVRVAEIRASCDITATVKLRIAKSTPIPVRMFFKAVTIDGSAISRGLVIPDNWNDNVTEYKDGDQLEGRITFHMVLNCADYKQFAKIVFISRSSFNDTAKELRDRNNK